MSVDLGDLTDLAIALGLLRPGGDPQPGWFADPAAHLKTMLTDPDQRTALLSALDDLLGGEVSTDSAGRTWLPVFENAPLAVYVVLDDAQSAVHVGLGVRVTATPGSDEVGLDVEAVVPLFAAGGSSTLLLGRAGASVEATMGITLPAAAGMGSVSLDSVEVSATIPTWGPLPQVGLSLRGLRLPGAASAQDVEVSAERIDELPDVLLDLVIALLHSATSSLPSGDAGRAFAGLLGLVDGDAVPQLPIDEVLASGPRALAGWWAQCLSGAARTDWLSHLATLLGGSLTGPGADATMAVPLPGGLTAVLDLTTTPGTSGLPVVTPKVTVQVSGAAGSTLELAVEPVSLDLATGTAVALPSLSALVRVTSGGVGALLGPVSGPDGLQITAGSFEGGFALDTGRRPLLVLAALDAVVGSTPYDRLDLTDGDALAGVATQALESAAASLLDALGPLGDTVGVLLGLTDPPGGPAPRVDPVALLSDPIGAVRARWLDLLAGPADTVREVLGVWQQATAAAAVRALPVTGDGSAGDPYAVAVADGVSLLLTQIDGAAPRSVVNVALAAVRTQPLALGAQVEAHIRIGLLQADLAVSTATAQVGTGLIAVLALGGIDQAPIRLTANGFGLLITGLGARFAWTPVSGARVDPWLDRPLLLIGGRQLSLDGIGVAGVEALDLPPSVPAVPAAWPAQLSAALEDLAGALLREAYLDLVATRPEMAGLLDLAATATGWATPVAGPQRLGLAGLIADPAAELERWAGQLLALAEGARPQLPEAVIGVLAQLLGVRLPGVGVDGVPWALALPGQVEAALPEAGGSALGFGIDLPSLVLALGNPTTDRFGSQAPVELVGWRPGDEGLSSELLAAGISRDAEVDELIGDALAGRGPLDAGFDALVERWGGTDGVIALPDDLVPMGVTAWRPSELPHTTRLDAPVMAEVLDQVWQTLGGVPERLVLVGVVADGEPELLPISATLVIDLTLADAPVEAFAVPAMAPVGTTAIRLAGKAGAAASGAGDGFTGQVARLRRALEGLTAGGTSVAVVAAGAAGRPAVQAAAGLAGVSAVVTVATPWTPLTLDDVDVDPAAGAVRMLATLLDLGDADLAANLAGLPDDERAAAQADDEDLALGRSLVGALLLRDGRGDPLTELSAPDLPIPAGIPVHAVVGSCAPEAVRRAITAVVAAGLAARSERRVLDVTASGSGAPGAPPATARLGLHLPAGLGVAAGGLRAAAGVELDLVRFTATGIAGPALRIRLRIAGDGRWLLGGPDPARTPGPRPLAVRAATLDLTVALPGWGMVAAGAGAVVGSGRLVLHDAQAFGVRKTRWLVDLSDAAPLLPEARALLGGIAAELGADPDPAVTALADVLTAVGILDAAGGFDATTLAGLLADPGEVLRAALADASRAGNLAAGLRGMLGDTRADAGTTVQFSGMVADLAGPSLTVTAATDLGSGGPRMEVDLTAGATGATVSARLGAAGDLGVPGLPAGDLAATATLGTGAAVDVAVTATLRDPRGPHPITLWPPSTAAGEALLALIPDAAAATGIMAAVRGLRSTLTSLESAAPAGLVDAVLAAIGLLRGSGDTASIAWPSGLVSDPLSWLQHATADLAGAVSGLVDAATGLLPGGAPLPAGTLPITDGVELRAADDGAGRLAVTLVIDTAAFAGGPGDLSLTLSAGADLATTGPASALPAVSVDVGVPGVGVMRVRLGTLAGGFGVSVAVVPDGRPEIVIHPSARGLAGLADAAASGAVAALPPLLTRLAAEDPADPAPATTAVQLAGRITARAGRALGLAAGVPAVFSESALADFAANPAAAFQSLAASLAADGLALAADAAEAALGTSVTRSVTSSAGRLALGLGPADRQVVIGWTPGTGAVDVSVTVTGVTGIGDLAGSATLTPSGVSAIDVAVGPATIPIGGVTLEPYARLAAGASRPGPVVDLGLGAGGDLRLVARFAVTGAGLAVEVLEASGPIGTPAVSADPEDVARAVVAVLLELAESVVLGIDQVQTALARPAVASATVTELLDGALLLTGPLRLDPELTAAVADADALLRRLTVLVSNLADAMPAPVSLGGVLEVQVTSTGPSSNRLLGVTLDVTGEEWILDPGGDVQVGLVSDPSWIDPAEPAGITLEAVRLTPTGIRFVPGLVVGGVGVRFSRGSGPLLDAAISIDAVSLLGFGLIQANGSSVDLGGGARVEVAGLAVAISGGGDGSNPVAEGLMPSGGSGGDAPAPRFSPALAVQQHPRSAFAVSLTAGSGSGPWWLAVQRDFGPIYLEQVGLAVDQDAGALKTIGLLIDGKVTLFGLSATVDDLSFTYTVLPSGSPFDPSRWAVDVAGFAVTADLGGLTLAGGLRKFTPEEGGLEYLGMLLARLTVYGITVYGGFGQVGPPADQYSSLFLFGAVNGPIGGPAAFFVTGIGGGFGANRGLVVPADLSQFDSYPLIKALDPAARPGDPFTELAQTRDYFPAQRGQFWFAAGLSFTSFTLVDGVVVVAVAFGNGFELSLLGLARMALPDESAALVSIELALAARVSTSEGVILVQAQLTDNSWLLAPEVRLTGGFAFASWFAGANSGQFVLTMGGYHPDFHRDGYPVVPRLGLAWRIGSAISITGESYFALTSEALMAGTNVEVHATIGPAWAHLVFGADGIVYFDPFFLNVTVYASIDAGVTVDLWFAEVTVSVHLSAKLMVTGPPFRAVATFEVGPVSVTFEIGDAASTPPPLTWAQFVPKYLEEASTGVARALAAVTGVGTVPPAGGAASGGDVSPDGQPDRPFRVVAEFTATVTSTIPVSRLITGTSTRALATSRTVSVAPMGEDGDATPTVTLRLRHRKLSGSGAGGPDTTDDDQITALIITPRADGAYPVGAWGEAQDLAHPKVPAGDVITATDRVQVVASAIIPGTGPGEQLPPAIPYRQVEIGKRRVNPLLPSIDAIEVGRIVTGAAALHTTVEAARTSAGPDATDTDVAQFLLSTRGGRDPLEVHDWRAGLAAPVLLGSLGEGLAGLGPAASVAGVTPTPAERPAPRQPQVLAALASGQPRVLRGGDDGGARLPVGGTTVSDSLLRQLLDRDPAAVPRLAPSTRREVGAGLDPALPARLVQTAPRAKVFERVTGAATRLQTVVAAGAPPVTGSGSAGVAAIAARASAPVVLRGLHERGSALLSGQDALLDGQVVVLDIPDAETDTDTDRRPRLVCRTGRLRAVLLGASGRVLADRVLGPEQAQTAVVGTRAVVLIGGPSPDPDPAPWWVCAGWTAARPLPSASDGVLLGAGCVVDVLGAAPYRGAEPARVCWASPAELLGGERGIATTVAAPVARAGVGPAPGKAAVTAVAVALTGAGTAGLAIGLRGAEQVGDLVLTTDPAGAGVAIAAVRAEPGVPVRMTVASDLASVRGQLGVLAAAGDSATIEQFGLPAAAVWLAESVAAGLPALAAPPTIAGPGRSAFVWEEPDR